MKIIFFSDAHGNQYAVEQFFKDIEHTEYDQIIFGGDVFGYYYGADQIIDMLKNKGVYCLLGNHDRMFLDILEGKRTEESLIAKYGNSYHDIVSKISKENVEYLYSLQSRLDTEIDGLFITFVHGSVEDPLNGRVYPDAVFDNKAPYEGIDYVFSGHTHHKMVKHVDSRTTVINPGSIGQQRDGKGCSYLIFDTLNHTLEFRVVSYDVERLVEEIETNDFGVMQEKLKEVLLRTPKYRENKD